MSNTIYFNAFNVRINSVKWHEFVIKRRSGKIDKQIRTEIGRLWRDGLVLAESTGSGYSWLLLRKMDIDVLSSHAYIEVPFGSVPPSVILNFYVITRSESAGSRAVFVAPTKKYWEARRSKKEDLRYCLYPQFSMWQETLIVNVSATCIRTANAKHKKAFQVFESNDSMVHKSVGYRVPKDGEIIKDPPAKGAKVRIPWSPTNSDAGPLASKMNFLSWLMSDINISGIASLVPIRFDCIPLKLLIGARGQDAKVTKKKMIQAITSVRPTNTVDIYDRRTEAGNHVSWDLIIAAMRRTAIRFGIEIKDLGSSPHQPGLSPVFVAIDSEDVFETEDIDTKAAAVAGFFGPVQCFSSGILKESENEVDEVVESVFLVMMTNFYIKLEVAESRLLMHREWACQTITGSVSDYMFCERFEIGENALYVGLHISTSGELTFTGFNSLPNLFSIFINRQTIPVFKLNQGDPSLEQWPGTIVIQDTPVKALPLLSREDMTPHFSGVRIIKALNCYYAGGAERPSSGKVEKALVLRQVTRIGGNNENDLEIMAGFCVDPTVRVHAATVWPAPFKLIREYVTMKHGASTTPEINQV